MSTISAALCATTLPEWTASHKLNRDVARSPTSCRLAVQPLTASLSSHSNLKIGDRHCSLQSSSKAMPIASKAIKAHPGRSVQASAATPTSTPVERVGARSSGSISASELLAGAEAAAKKGAEVISEALDKPRNISYKGATDLVTDTDQKAETAILAEVRERFPGHLILGEEGGVSGDPSSEYLWCIDPLGQFF
eukprot:jgi/Mesen1/8501/ME000480S07856